MKNFLIVDGNNLLYRSYYVAEKFLNWEGENKTIFIFLRILISLLKGNKYQKFLIAFDSGGKENFRYEISEDYKANRPKMPPLLFNQFQIIQETLQKTNLASIKLENCEADDLIASFVEQNNIAKVNFDIFSQDKDLLQLLAPDSSENSQINICKYLNKETIIFTYEDFIKENSFLPINYVDYLSLSGDKVDNLSGAEKVGSKRAKEMIKKFFTIENLYQNIGNIKETEVKKSLETNKNLIFQNKRLILLKKDLILPIELEECNFSWEKWKKNSRLIEICHKYKFNSILKTLDN